MMSLWSRGVLAASFGINVLTYITVGLVLGSTALGGITLETFDLRHTFILLGGVCHAASNVSFLKLSSVMPEEASVVAPLTSVYIVFPAVVGMVAFGEAVTALKIIGIFVAVLAVFLMSVRDLHELYASIRGRSRKDDQQHQKYTKSKFEFLKKVYRVRTNESIGSDMTVDTNCVEVAAAV